MSGCCSPSREPGREPVAPVAASLSGGLAGDLVHLAGGTTAIGSDDPEHPEEWPVREVSLAPYRIARTAVSNAEFAEFVNATGHRTDAEAYGWSFVFGGLLPDDFPPTRGVAAAPWWREVHGADWAHPEGPHSGLDGRLDHPVVHVSRRDAEAYAAWRGGRLPTEAEWEHAARGGRTGDPFPWGGELEPEGQHRMNVWQGSFPAENSLADGWLGTCPVDQFEPNGYGLHNTSGNVWEWCANDFDPRGMKAIRGGSYLCHDSYCNRYRVAARSSNTADSSTGNTGFRCAADLAG